jgi:hypothetical protein
LHLTETRDYFVFFQFYNTTGCPLQKKNNKMELSGSGQGPVAGPEENDIETSDSTTSGGFLDWVGDY